MGKGVVTGVGFRGEGVGGKAARASPGQGLPAELSLILCLPRRSLELDRFGGGVRRKSLADRWLGPQRPGAWEGEGGGGGSRTPLYHN